MKLLESNFFIFLVISIICGILFISKFYGEDYSSKEVFGSFLSISYSWSTCLTILGIGKKYFDKEYIFTKFMKKNSYGIYIFHHLFISSTAYYLHIYTNFIPFIQYILVCFSSFFGSIILFNIMSKIPFINWCVLSIRKK